MMVDSPIVGGVIHSSAFLIVLVLYFLPSIVAVARKVTHQGSVVVLNLFLGWTLVGWVIALAMACRTNRVLRD
jgi:TRAP-type C4-dicarboxylate transport system permease large subunit